LRTTQRLEETGISSRESLASLSSVLEIDKAVLSLPESALIKGEKIMNSDLINTVKRLYSHLLVLSAVPWVKIY